MSKVLALTKDGKLSQCSVSPELRGNVRGCPHVGHAYEWETPEQTTARFSDLQKPYPSNYNNDALNREYNRKAYFETVEKLNEYGKVCIVQGTSTGKSSIFCRIAEDFDGKKVLILTPSKEQVGQLRDDYHVNGRVATYNEFCKIGLNELAQYDLLVIDECHHIGKEDNISAMKVNDMLNDNPNLKIIGATATPLRTDKLNPIDNIFNGVSSSNISTEEVFEAGYLRKPRVVLLENTNQFERDYIDLVNKKDSAIYTHPLSVGKTASKLYSEIVKTKEENNKIIEDELTNKIKLNIDNKEASKILIYCEDAGPAMEATKNYIDPIIRKACERNRIEMNSSKFTDSRTNSMSSKERKDIMKEFKNDNKVEVLYVYDMLGEGVHIEGVNMGINARSTTSIVKPSQTLGRILNGPDKQKSDPLYIDMSGYGEFDKKIEYSNCLTNRKTIENYGELDKLYREVTLTNKRNTRKYGDRIMEYNEIMDAMSDEYHYNFNEKNKSQIRDWLNEGLSPEYIMEERRHLLDAYNK